MVEAQLVEEAKIETWARDDAEEDGGRKKETLWWLLLSLFVVVVVVVFLKNSHVRVPDDVFSFNETCQDRVVS